MIQGRSKYIYNRQMDQSKLPDPGLFGLNGLDSQPYLGDTSLFWDWLQRIWIRCGAMLAKFPRTEPRTLALRNAGSGVTDLPNLTFDSEPDMPRFGYLQAKTHLHWWHRTFRGIRISLIMIYWFWSKNGVRHSQKKRRSYSCFYFFLSLSSKWCNTLLAPKLPAILEAIWSPLRRCNLSATLAPTTEPAIEAPIFLTIFNSFYYLGLFKYEW